MRASWTASPSHPRRLVAVIADCCDSNSFDAGSIAALSDVGGPLWPMAMTGIETTRLLVVIEKSGYDKITLSFLWEGEIHEAVLTPSFEGFDCVIDGDNQSNCAHAMSSTIFNMLNQMVEIKRGEIHGK